MEKPLDNWGNTENSQRERAKRMRKENQKKLEKHSTNILVVGFSLVYFKKEGKRESNRN